ncbi:PanM family protein [Acinetobacter qingfengensis]|uniref:GNAT family N-acetyltransferase n=1 Tax=Acinetobacter qingfengensis TaxID=1262585 RepID=A0A1E7QYY5_9GAMM|nr:acetyl-CoA sensor PanZ family protein [Acinetobacter qingfengensis]KAA8733128.1 PanM family protein [Acinetobacter qingfengensis]OEY92277.1 GNAT family N-acetyltransferase [Acinetobacter qingfengensis]
MPIQVQAVTDVKNAVIRNQIERLYENSPEFADGQQAIVQLEQALKEDTVLYVAIFNDKIIGAVWCQRTDQSSLLDYVVVHPANRDRGVAERLVTELCHFEEIQGVTQFQPGCGVIHRCLQNIGKLSNENH